MKNLKFVNNTILARMIRREKVKFENVGTTLNVLFSDRTKRVDFVNALEDSDYEFFQEMGYHDTGKSDLPVMLSFPCSYSSGFDRWQLTFQKRAEDKFQSL